MTPSPEVPGYRLDARLGEGMGGAVYRAWRGDHEVALKCIDPRHLETARGRARIRREVEVLRAHPHECLVRLLDAQVETRPAYLAFEILSGGTLVDVFQARRRPPRLLILAALARVARALEHLHGLGILHRDIKPTNVLLDAGGRAFLGDLGLARGEGDAALTSTGFVVGTPEYMAPEVLRGEPASPQSDLFSFAVMAVQLLTGFLPPASADGREVPDEVWRRVTPPPLRQLLRRLLRLDPEDRDGDAGAVARLLEGLVLEPPADPDPAPTAEEGATATLVGMPGSLDSGRGGRAGGGGAEAAGGGRRGRGDAVASPRAPGRRSPAASARAPVPAPAPAPAPARAQARASASPPPEPSAPSEPPAPPAASRPRTGSWWRVGGALAGAALAVLALASAFRTASRPAGLHLEVLEAPTAAEVDPAGRVASDLAGGRLRLQAGPSLWSLDPDGQVTERLDLRPWMARAEAVVAAPGGAVVVGRPGHAGGAASGDDDPLPASATRSAADDLVVLALRRQGESLQVRWRREVRAGPGRRAALGGMVGGVEGMALVTRVLRLGEGPRHDQTFERAQLLTFDPDAALRWERPLAGAPGDDWRLLAAGTQGLLLWTRGALALASTRSPSARAVALPGEAWTRPPRAAAGTPSGFELVRSDGLAVALRAP